jgi:hypothetical protein
MPRVGVRGKDDDDLLGVAALSLRNVWAAGHWWASTPGGGLMVHWDGTRWRRVRIPRSKLKMIEDVSAVSPTEVWAVGHTYAAPRPPAMYVLRICPVSVADGGYSRASARVPLGLTAAWAFGPANEQLHTVTEGSGLGLFGSGPRSAGGSFTATFTAAGRYPIVDRATDARMSIAVPPRALPRTGSVSDSYDIRWAMQRTPGRLVFDVMVRTPGASQFEPWLEGTTSHSAAFHPLAGSGTYEFRSRARDNNSGFRSRWSPVVTVEVN